MILGFHPRERFGFGQRIIKALKLGTWTKFVVCTVDEQLGDPHFINIFAVRVFGRESNGDNAG
jgi:hypothetical protein